MQLRGMWRFRILRWSVGVLGLLALLLALFAVTMAWLFRASLPILEGEVRVVGLRQTVEVERDAAGIVTIRAADRLDLARATGFVHAQDRFFSMDLQRRFGSGELAALIGAVALPIDRQRRVHAGPGAIAEMFAGLPAEQKALLEAYADGVNAGLASLGSRPPEYWLLRERPQPWRARDTLAVAVAMAYVLQDADARMAWTAERARATLPEEVVSFLFEGVRFGEAPLDWDPDLGAVAIPFPAEAWAQALERFSRSGEGFALRSLMVEEPYFGSNAWVVGPERTRGGRALLAGDPHLGLSVPNTWYRMSLHYEDEGEPRSLHGATFPGAPFLVAGSNTRVAWSLTNSYARMSDLVRVEADPADPLYYLTPHGRERFGLRREEIFVKGQREPVMQEVKTTRWGPIRQSPSSMGLGPEGVEPVDAEQEADEPLYALFWLGVAQDGLSAGLNRLEAANSLDELFAASADGGIPTQNLIAADAGGRIGWTLLGRLHDRKTTPQAFALEGAEADALLAARVPASAYPRILDPASGTIWSANHRKVGGTAGALIGEGGFARDGRALRIRDQLLERSEHDASSFLELLLDARTVFFDEYRDLLMGVLDYALEGPVNGSGADPRFERMREVLRDWEGTAGVDSFAYRLLEAWYARASEGIRKHLFAPLGEGVFPTRLPGYGEVLRRVMLEQPSSLVPEEAADWNAFHTEILAAIAEAVFDDSGNWLPTATWGAHNRLDMRHPFSRMVPLASRWLDMPADPLPGSTFSPRVQGRTFGASFRMVVSPGEEAAGLFHMPGGNAGHFLSPFYRAGHADWVNGRAVPLLPGETKHRLRLHPVP